MPFVDFSAIKAALSIEQAASFLKLELRKAGAQLRAACPVCKAGGDRAIVLTPAKNLFYCFPAEKGGDCIALVAHVKDIGVKEAAELLAEAAGLVQSKGTSTVRKERDNTEPQAPGALEPLDHLQHNHPAVEALGLEAETAEALGVGYAARGLMRGTVAFPIRLPDGSLTGYIGVTECKLPPKFRLTTNVVPFGKKSA